MLKGKTYLKAPAVVEDWGEEKVSTPWKFSLQWEGCQHQSCRPCPLLPASMPPGSSKTRPWDEVLEAPGRASAARRHSPGEPSPRAAEQRPGMAHTAQFAGFGHLGFPLSWAWQHGNRHHLCLCPSGLTELSLCGFLREKHFLFLYTFDNAIVAVTVHFLFHCFLFSLICYLNP